MTEKSAVIVVVEGYSDMASIGTILKEYFSSTETQFVITRGDITSRDGVTPANVITKLKTEIDTVRTKYGYQWKETENPYVLRLRPGCNHMYGPVPR